MYILVSLSYPLNPLFPLNKFSISFSTRPDVAWSDMNIVWHRVRPEIGESEIVPIGMCVLAQLSKG